MGMRKGAKARVQGKARVERKARVEGKARAQSLRPVRGIVGGEAQRAEVITLTGGKLVPGPYKPSPRNLPGPRITTHKLRGTWFQSRASWPVREAPVAQLTRERTRVREALGPPPGTARWESDGPTNIGGRLTSVVCDPTNAQRVWVGAAGGGVWRSIDGGMTWEALWHQQDILNIGALAVRADNSQILYCGTGEANLSADSYPGVGLYQSTDGGDTWRLLAASAQTGVPRRIGVLAIDPFDPNHILLGGVSHRADQTDRGGLYTSVDTGVTWTRADFISTNNYFCHAIVFHPAQPGTVFVTVTALGPKSGIWKSVDGGATWVQLTSGLPDSARFGRTSLAISPSDPRVMYVLARDVLSGRSDRVLDVFRSADGGESWRGTAGNHFNAERQMSYNNTIAVHPTNPNHVLCGGVDLHLTTDGGQTWKRVTDWRAERGTSIYAHADHHALLMPAGDRVYDANDGGLDLSDDGGATWSNRSNGLAVTMFYDLEVAQSDGRLYGGGAQDNGTLITTDGRADNFFELLGGDGGWIVIDPTNAEHLYASFQFMGLFRWRPGEPPKAVTPPVEPGEAERIWMAIVVMDPSNARTVFVGSHRVWRTKNDAQTWTAVSPGLDDSPITAIEVAAADPRRVYVGTENGGIFRSLEGGNPGTWSPNIASATLPGRTITRLETGPTNAARLFATVADFGHSHVFRSDDGGITWVDVDRGQLPDVPHHAVLIPPDDPDTVYVANDAGVFVSPDLGQTWMSLTRNLPNAMAVDLVYHAQDGTLTAATYGRSLWRIQVR